MSRFLPFRLLLGAVLAGCAQPLPPVPDVPVDPAWQAPLPHGGQVADLRRWWAGFGDPLLPRLIGNAQTASPTLARAAANIADARAARVTSAALLLPAIDAVATATRGRADLAAPAGTAASAGLQATWELDLFGAAQAGADAAQARLQASEATWHDARISIAAEVARTYVELRACQALVNQAETDAASRARTARLTDAATAAGFRSPATAALARASAAQGQVALIRQQADCDLLVKALVALTARGEPALRRDLALPAAQPPLPADLAVAAMPAAVLAQRPDIRAAALDVAAALAAATEAEARRWPRVTLGGSIGAASLASLGTTVDGPVWSIGPVTVTFPVFDGGTRRAGAQAARIRYETAKTVYAARLRDAVQEVERALVILDSTRRRRDDAGVATDGFARSYQATAASYDAGAASLFDLEDARRSLLAAQNATIDLQRERLVAWIGLYRAIGGGWTAAELRS